MSQTETYPYATHLDIRYPPLEVVDVSRARRELYRPLVQPETSAR
jgi:hypothetical protein